MQNTAMKSCFKKMEKATHYFRRKLHRNYNDCDDSDGTMCQMSYTDQRVLTVVCKLWSCVSWKFSLEGGSEKEKKNKMQCFSDFVTKNFSSFRHSMLQTLASLHVTPPPLPPAPTPTPPPRPPHWQHQSETRGYRERTLPSLPVPHEIRQANE